MTFLLAREFGFCYGVDRAVEYAYETRTKFPEKRVFLVGEIIHNPHVNSKLLSMGVVILQRSEEHTSEPSHLGISYAVFCLKKKTRRAPGYDRIYVAN